MDLEGVPNDAKSRVCVQKKRKNQKKRHIFKENDHADHIHSEVSSSVENKPHDTAPHEEPPANNSTKLDLEAHIDPGAELSEKKNDRNKKERRHCALTEKTLGHEVSESTSSKKLSTEEKYVGNTHLLEKTEPSTEVGSYHKKLNKRKKKKRRHDKVQINGIDHDLHEVGHMCSTDFTIINHSEKVDGGFTPDTSSVKNHEKTVDSAAFHEMRNDTDINKRKARIKTYKRRETKPSTSSENNLESIKEGGMNSSLQVVQGNKLGRLQLEDGTSIHPLEDIPLDADFVNCAASKPASGKRKKKMDSNLKDSIDENVLVNMLIVPTEITEPVNEVKPDKMEVTLQDEAENMEEETKLKEIIPSSSHLGAIKDDVELVDREENPRDLSPQLERAVISHSRKKLLILDVNGLLVDIVPYFVKGYVPDIIVSRKSVFKRPFCDDFLQFCFERFKVGIWTSRTKKNINMVLDFLMVDTRDKLLFCWDQSQCTDTGFTTHDNPDKPLLLKELRKLWDKHEQNLPWEKGDYNESNTLLLDDSPYKALLNPEHTAIFPYSYEYKDAEDDMLAPGGKLRNYLEGLAMADNVQEYVKQNPLGQKSISKSSATWHFYRKVLRKYSYKQEEDVRSPAC